MPDVSIVVNAGEARKRATNSVKRVKGVRTPTKMRSSREKNKLPEWSSGYSKIF